MRFNLLLVAALFFCTVGFSQKIKVSEGNFKINDGSHNGMKVMIYEQSSSEVEKAWKSEMKKTGAKISSKAGVEANNAVVKTIGEHPCDVYATFTKSGDGTEMVVAFNLGGAYLSSSQHGDQYKATETFVEKFATHQVHEAISTQVKDAEKNLKDGEKEVEKLEGEKNRLVGDIEKYKNLIIKAEKDLEDNKKNQEDAKAKVEDLKKAVDAVKAKESKYN